MFKLVQAKDRKIGIVTILHAVGRASSDADLRKRLRTVAAVLVARHCEHDPSDVVDIVTQPDFYDHGRVATTAGTMWLCSYVGYERITSQWGKEKGYSCVICVRLVEMSLSLKELKEHTLQIYF